MNLSELLTLKDVEKRAVSIMPSATLGYYQSGADEERTLQDNINAFNRFLLLPRMLVNVHSLNSQINILGRTYSLPFGFAPTAMHCLAHPDGEKATAKVAAQNGMLMILSTLSTTSLEDVAKSGGPEASLWFQLYVYKDRNLTIQIVRRVEKAGYRAIVLTVDAPFFGRRLADCRGKFALPPHLKLANFQGLNQANVPSASSSGNDGNESGLFVYIKEQLDQTLTWEAVDWLRSITKLPIIVKGILSPEDALQAVAHGAAGIIVSNHGGRQVDCVPSSIEALPAVVKAVSGHCPVMVDGGIRCGTDILKALALGAKMVFFGRPVLYGLAVGGYDGLNHVVDIFRGELERAMALCGCPDAANIPRSIVIHRKNFTAQL